MESAGRLATGVISFTTLTKSKWTGCTTDGQINSCFFKSQMLTVYVIDVVLSRTLTYEGTAPLCFNLSQSE